MHADKTDSFEPPPERTQLPADARTERDAIIFEIHRAFSKVTRDGGISWTECEALDKYASEEECERARRADRDRRWTELADDPKWQPFPGMGGFSFIDAIGFRYYLPPTMIRFLRGEGSDWYPEHFPSVLSGFAPQDARNEFRGLSVGPAATWTSAQLRCIARFMSFMSRHDPTGWADEERMAAWREVLAQGWSQHL